MTATGLELVGAEHLMTRDLASHPAPPVPEPLRVEHSDRSTDRLSLLEVSVPDSDGALAAAGRAGVTGPWAVFAGVVTAPAHRRRGIGSAVMGALAGRARDRFAADRGVLVATPDGHRLYTALGWQVVADVVTGRASVTSS